VNASHATNNYIMQDKSFTLLIFRHDWYHEGPIWTRRYDKK